MFASKVKKTVELEDGVSVVIKKLSARKLDLAREEKQRQFASTARAFGPDLLKSLRNSTPEERAEAEANRARAEAAGDDGRYSSLDRSVVLVAGIDSWNVEPPVSAAAIDDLDETAADTLFHAIVDLSIPPVDPKVAEEKLAKD